MTIDLLTLPPARASVTHAAAFDSRRGRVGGVPDYQPWLRIGLVFGVEDGMLSRLLTPFEFGLGGPMGSGRQCMSWVDREDVLRMIEWSIDQRSAHGVYNVTAPNPVRNRDFARALGRALHRPAFMPTPAFALRLALGREMADEMLLGGQRVVPARTAAEGFTFAYADLDAALKHAVA